MNNTHGGQREELGRMFLKMAEKSWLLLIGVPCVLMIGGMAHAQKGVPLDIESSSYKGVSWLSNPQHDTQPIIVALRDEGFTSVSKAAIEPIQNRAPDLAANDAQHSNGADQLPAGLVTDCDRLAGNPNDMQAARPGVGINLDRIEPLSAIAACEEATRRFPDVARFTYQKGRAFLAQKDYAKARQLFDEAAAKGSKYSITAIGNLYDLGMGVTRNYTQARQWYEKAAGMGEPQAMVMLGELYESSSNYAQARQWYERAAAAGKPVTMAHLGRLYAYGRYNTPDYAQARQWFEKGVAAGEAAAMSGLGTLYEDGAGVTQDYVQARQWYEKAAAAGDAAAMRMLGVLYEDGAGVARNYALARQWYEKAASAGDAPAMTNLGSLNANGKDVAPDYAKAREWYDKAATAGDAAAMRNLGILYEDGTGVAQDPVQARQWYEKASSAGNDDARMRFNTIVNKEEEAARLAPKRSKNR